MLDHGTAVYQETEWVPFLIANSNPALGSCTSWMPGVSWPHPEPGPNPVGPVAARSPTSPAAAAMTPLPASGWTP